MLDLIIIGGGPAGMSAAIYAARQKNDFLLIAKEFGGQMAKKEVAIENYPGLGRVSAAELIAKFRSHLEDLGAVPKIANASRIKKIPGGFEISADKENFSARAVIIATGAQPRFLDVPGEKEFIGRGVGYCAACDGPLFARREVAVIGGGNAGFEAALFLAQFAKKIHILERGSQVAADAANQELGRATGKIEIITGAKIIRINGDNFVQSLAYENNQGQEIVLPVEGIFIKAGYIPASELAGDLADLNERNEIKFDRQSQQTKTPGLFAAGDVSEIRFKQIVVAAAEGAKAAMAAGDYLRRL